MRSRLASTSTTARVAAIGSVLGVVVLITGPLYRVRSWWSYDEPLETDAFVIVVQGVLAAAGVAVLATGGRWRRVEPLAGAFGAALVVWLVASSTWSIDVPTTLRHSLLVAGTMAAGAAAATILSTIGLVAVVWVGVHIGLAWSAVAIYTVQPRTQDSNGDWAGIFVNRNSLALYAALGLVTSVLLAWVVIRRAWAALPTVLAVSATGGAVVADVVLLAGTDSLTPLAAAVLTTGALVLALAGRALIRRGRPVAPIVLGAGLAVVVVGAGGWLLRGPIGELTGRDPGGTGRAALWEVSWEWYVRSPIVGQGYMAPWSDDAFLADVLVERGTLLYSAHSSFVDILLGGGLVGAVLIVAVVATCFWNVSTTALTGDRPEHLFPLALFVFAVVEHTTETLFVAGQLMVAVLGAVLVTATPRARSPDSDRPGWSRARPGRVDAAEPIGPLVGADRAAPDR